MTLSSYSAWLVRTAAVIESGEPLEQLKSTHDAFDNCVECSLRHPGSFVVPAMHDTVRGDFPMDWRRKIVIGMIALGCCSFVAPLGSAQDDQDVFPDSDLPSLLDDDAPAPPDDLPSAAQGELPPAQEGSRPRCV